MKVIIEIDNEKAVHLMAILQDLDYVTIQEVSDEKEVLISEIKEAIENLNLVKAGQLSARPVKELLDEL